MRPHVGTLASCRLLVGMALSLGSPASAVVIDWTLVGDPGNSCDLQSQGCFGSVAYAYDIGTYEVTNSQYAEFLNAVAGTDTNALYNPDMGSVVTIGGITRSGSAGSYSYGAIAGRGDMPVNHVSFYSALRFANWLHNGQPTGVQNGATTEDGAYTITIQGINDNSIVRNAGAAFAVTSEDEWYKAAYYDAPSTSYFDYPAGFDAQTLCAAPTGTANRANCGNIVADLTDVGAYTGSPSPYGTFDQAGNLIEWNEAIISGTDRGIRGGSFLGGPTPNAASIRSLASPTGESIQAGFRVVPEPAAQGLGAILGMLGVAYFEKRRV